MTLALSTELEAVNTILAAVGESPIVELDGDSESFTDAELARTKLNQALRRHQTHGWTFNTLIDYVLTPNGDGHLLVPANTIRFTTDDNDTNMVIVSGKLLDRSTNSYVFTETKTGRIVVTREFLECPEPMRDWATITAALSFQDDYRGDNPMRRFKQQDEMMAKAAMWEHEWLVGDLNVLSGDGGMATLMGTIKGRR